MALSRADDLLTNPVNPLFQHGGDAERWLSMVFQVDNSHGDAHDDDATDALSPSTTSRTFTTGFIEDLRPQQLRGPSAKLVLTSRQQPNRHDAHRSVHEPFTLEISQGYTAGHQHEVMPNEDL